MITSIEYTQLLIDIFLKLFRIAIWSLKYHSRSTLHSCFLFTTEHNTFYCGFIIIHLTFHFLN